MNQIVRLALISIISLTIFSLTASCIFSFLYQSETEKAIQESSLYLEQAKKNQEAYLEAKYKNENIALKRQLEFERKVYLQTQNSKPSYGYKINIEEQRVRQALYDEKRQKIREEKKEKQRILREKNKRRAEQDRADRIHIRKENMKTCKFWSEKYRELPSDKTKLLKEKSCKRAYQ